MEKWGLSSLANCKKEAVCEVSWPSAQPLGSTVVCSVGFSLLGSRSTPIPKVRPSGWEIAIDSGECKGLYCIIECSHDYSQSSGLIGEQILIEKDHSGQWAHEHLLPSTGRYVSRLPPSMKQKPGKMSLPCLRVGLFRSIDLDNSAIFLSTHS